jgi:Holliday junction resolvasome RuvABC endonuclease subunit
MPHAMMAIDPGLTGTGVAIWRRPGPTPECVTILTSRGAASTDWIDRVHRIAVQVQDLALDYSVREVVCEMMEMHGSARAQMMWKAGDFQRTLFLIGAIYGMTESSVIHWHVTPPSEWKGQLPKSVTINRVRALLGNKVCDRLDIQSHAWDAVGIGLWHQGILK